MVFDGDCGFCRLWISRWQVMTGDRVDYATSQDSAKDLPDIPPEKFQESVQLVETDGKVYQGAEAVFRSLNHAPCSREWEGPWRAFWS